MADKKSKKEELEEQVSAYSRRMSTTSESVDDLVGGMKEIVGSTFMASEQMQEFLNTSKALSATIKENADNMDKVVKGEMDVNAASKARTKQVELRQKLLKQGGNIEKSLSATKQKGQAKLSRSQKKGFKDQMNAIGNISKMGNKESSKSVDMAKKGTNSMTKGFGKLSGMFNKMGMDKLAKKSKGFASSIQKAKIQGKGLVGQMNQAATGNSKILGFLSKAGGLVGTLFVAAIKLILEANDEVVTLGRNLQISANEAADVRQHFVNVANSVAMLGVEYADILKAQASLNDHFGTAVTMIHEDILGGMAILTERTKLSAEAALGYALVAIGLRKTTKEISDDAARGALLAHEEFGVRANITKVQEETGKVTGRVRALFIDNYTTLGKTVSLAMQLGTTIGEISRQSEGMLNFHDSIEKEMKAELMLGKQLNLEQARLAALTGDYDTYLKEVLKNTGDILDFNRMNVLQQNALAAALNMSTDQLADMLLKRADLNALQSKAREGELEEIERAQQQLSLQDAFNAAMEKFRAILINLAADIENLEILGWKPFRDLTEVTEESLSKLKGGIGKDVGGDEAAGKAAPLNDFTIRTHPKDELALMGGTSLLDKKEWAQSMGITYEQAEEMIRIAKGNRTFSYSGFKAVKADTHYGTKFGRWLRSKRG